MMMMNSITRMLQRNIHTSRPMQLIYRKVDDVSENTVKTDSFDSRRYLLQKDGLGFSLHHTILKKGQQPISMQYQNHVKAVFITKGEGELQIVGNDKKLSLSPGTMYALNHQENHIVTCLSDELHTICVFNPPITGKESRNEKGVYPVVDKDGHEHMEFDISLVGRLFEPPQSLKGGTCSLKDHPTF